MMKRTKTKSLLLCLMTLALLSLTATSKTSENQTQFLAVTEFPEDSVFKFVEKVPEFPEGTAMMFQYIAENFQIPVLLQENLPQGRVVLQFAVLKSGEINNIEVLRGFDLEFDQEAIRVIESMPLWIPGEQNGELVNAEYILQIRTDQYFAPQFPGGYLAFLQYLLDSIEYAQEWQEEDKKGYPEGRIILQFNVLESGKIDSVKVISGITPTLDKEVVRAIEAMPDWISAKRERKNVDARYILPINFQVTWLGNPDNSNKDTEYQQEEIQPGDFIFPVVFRLPEFSGGNVAMMQWLAKNMRYPIEAQRSGIQGRVILSFVVEETGEITDIEVVEGVSPDLDKEAVRVAKLMPHWSPAIQNNKFVRVRYTLPVIFRLQGPVVPTGRTSRTFFR
jgi:TonB family protein